MNVGALAALAGLPSMYPRRLRHLLQHHDPSDALDRLKSGRPLDSMFVRAVRGAGEAELRAQAACASAADAHRVCEINQIRVLAFSDPDFPGQLTVDHDPPAVLFVRGSIDALNARRVGIVGTRNATAAGRATAAELASELARHGVAVVSGLARGIDGAAHRGVRSLLASDPLSGGRPIAVVGNGLDRPYPKQNADLWQWVGTEGLLISEWPPGVGPEAWRFPLRNRILAALCEVLVVVESRQRGGSLLTVREAIDRNVEVMAVPGSPRSVASAGTNQLLVDGAAPVTCGGDVLDALSLDHRRQHEAPYDSRPIPDDVQTKVLQACCDAPLTLNELAVSLALPIAELAMAVARLERDGRITEADGWFELSGSRLLHP